MSNWQRLMNQIPVSSQLSGHCLHAEHGNVHNSTEWWKGRILSTDCIQACEIPTPLLFWVRMNELKMTTSVHIRNATERTRRLLLEYLDNAGNDPWAEKEIKDIQSVVTPLESYAELFQQLLPWPGFIFMIYRLGRITIAFPKTLECSKDVQKYWSYFGIKGVINSYK